MTSRQEEKFWRVGDCLHGAGTPKPGEAYSIPIVNEQGQICRMKIVDIEMDGPRHFWGVVESITPVRSWDPATRSVRTLSAERDIDWMTKAELNEAIPPAYTEFIGSQLLRHIEAGQPVRVTPERAATP